MRKENKQPFFYFILENDCRLKIEQCFVHGDLFINFFSFNYTKILMHLAKTTCSTYVQNLTTEHEHTFSIEKKNMFSRLNQAKKLLKLLQNTLKASSIYYILVVNFTCFVTFECYQSVKCPCPRLVGQKNACFFPM